MTRNVREVTNSERVRQTYQSVSKHCTLALDQLFVPGQQLHAYYEHTIQQYHVRSQDRASPPQKTNIAVYNVAYYDRPES